MFELGEAVLMLAVVGFSFGLLYIVAKFLIKSVGTDDNQD